MSSMFALWVATLIGAGGPVTALSVLPAAERTQVLIAVAGGVEYRDFTLESPNRLVVDLVGSVHALPRDEFPAINRGGVRALRTSQYAPEIVRVVLELDALVPYRIEAGESGIRITLENRAGTFEPWSSAPVTAMAALPLDPPAPAAVPAPIRAPAAAPARAGSAALAAGPRPAPVQEMRRISVAFEATPISDVLFTFAEFADRSIIAGSDVTGTVSAIIDNQPWDQALEAILRAQGLVATEDQTGIIRVDNFESVDAREEVEPLMTRSYRVNYATAAELVTALTPLATERGSITTAPGTNSLIVTDILRVHEAMAGLIQGLDVRTPQVQIQAKIVFVSRTDLEEFGITYDLKDSRGNQLNVVAPGATDTDGDGVIELPGEQVPTGTNVYSLGGNSVAALGNATSRVAGPSLTLLTSLLVGRHTLISFIEALQTLNLSEIQAVPSVTVLDNVQARIQVGEQTPLRVIDPGGGAVGGTLPTASVSIQETGIILEATPHVTAEDNILLELRAERSAPQPAESDVGFIFNTQNATTRVLVEDGETIVIGGLTVTDRSDVRTGIPLLMDLPLVGRLFRVNREQTIQRDLIILVTPHIVRN
jgi:type IV pilus assembly protein PilQ